MKVVLMACTPFPEKLCAQAMRGCQSTKAAFEIESVDTEHMMKLAVTTDDASVLEHAVFTFSVEGISRACSHQLVRHRIASYSQQSQRHVDPTKQEDWYITPRSIEGSVFAEEYDQLMERVEIFYRKLSHTAIKEEDIRFILPNACKTNIVITMNCRELRHFFKLRLAKKAQWEIRAMATEMWRQVVEIAPIIFGEFREVIISEK